MNTAEKAQPLYKRLWFWVIVVIAFITLGLNKQEDEVPGLNLEGVAVTTPSATGAPAAPASK
jgi:hypothetical protein